MNWTYFKKYDPGIPLNDDYGRRIEFRDLGGQWGVLATADNYLIAALRKAQREARGGVMEITEAEYTEIQKKKTTFSRRWREVVGHLHLRRLYESARRSAVAANRLPADVRNAIGEVNALVRPHGVNDMIPKVVRR